MLWTFSTEWTQTNLRQYPKKSSLCWFRTRYPKSLPTVLPEIYKFFSRSDPKGVTKSNFVRALIEIKLVDRVDLLYERTKWADILFKKIGE
jgi:hypothetical protein